MAAVLVVLIAGPVAFLTVSLIRAEIRLSVRNGQADISVPLYSWSFRLSDIDGIQVLDSMPRGMRTNGFSAGQKCIGHFVLEGIGSCRVYVSQTKEPVLMVSLRDRRPCLLNGETEEQTALWREMLLGQD